MEVLAGDDNMITELVKIRIQFYNTNIPLILRYE